MTSLMLQLELCYILLWMWIIDFAVNYIVWAATLFVFFEE